MFRQLAQHNTNTLLLYVGIVVVSTIFAYLSQPSLSNQYGSVVSYFGKRKIVSFCASFAVLAFFAAVNSVGIDKEAYTYFFEISSFGNLYANIEPGFRFLIGLIKLFTNNPQVFLGIIAFTTISLVFFGIWSCRNVISIGLAVFIFSSQYYFQSFNLMRMYLAISIPIAGVKLFLDGKRLWYLFLILFSSLFHYSMLIVAVAYAVAFIFIKNEKISENKLLIILGTTTMVISYFLPRIVDELFGFAGRILGSNNLLLMKYSIYIDKIVVTNRLGFKWLFNLFPYIGVLILLSNNDKRECWSVTAGYLIVTIAISILGYSIPVIGRALVSTNMPLVIILPIALQKYRDDMIINRVDRSAIIRFRVFKHAFAIPYSIVVLIFVLYFIVSFFIYLDGYMSLDGIDNFRFIWNT